MTLCSREGWQWSLSRFFIGKRERTARPVAFTEGHAPIKIILPQKEAKKQSRPGLLYCNPGYSSIGLPQWNNSFFSILRKPFRFLISTKKPTLSDSSKRKTSSFFWVISTSNPKYLRVIIIFVFFYNLLPC